ncbi:MAG TPA: hypothetical protein VF879_06405, partial [Nitrospirales bacterium]
MLEILLDAWFVGFVTSRPKGLFGTLEGGAVQRNWVHQQSTLAAAGFAIGLSLLLSRAASAAANPNGWIQTSGWNYLLPLRNDAGCTGGGLAKLAGNWVAPHNIGSGSDNPVPGTEWGDIDFNATALSNGYEGGGLFAKPRWLSNLYLESTEELPPGSMPNGDYVDFAGIVNAINTVIVPKHVGAQSLPKTNALAVATTYITNLAPTSISVSICTSSSDSIQVWLNGTMIGSVSQCRTAAANCVDSFEGGQLIPGRNKLTVLVWQGADDWGFRIRLFDTSQPLPQPQLLRDGNPRVTFDGTGPGTTYFLVRKLPEQAVCPRKSVAVVLKGSGTGSASTSLRVTERIVPTRQPTAQFLQISAVSNGGAVTDFFDSGVQKGKVITWNVPRSAITSGLSYTLGYSENGDIALVAKVETVTPDVTGMVYIVGRQTGPVGPPGDQFDNSHDIGDPAPAGLTFYDTSTSSFVMRASGADIWNDGDQFQYAYRTITGDFAVGVRVTGRVAIPSGQRWGKHGLMARWTCDPSSKYSMVQTSVSSSDQPLDEPRHVLRLQHMKSWDTREAYLVKDGIFKNRQPAWMCLVRRGKTIYSYLSDDDNGKPSKWCFV